MHTSTISTASAADTSTIKTVIITSPHIVAVLLQASRE